MRFAGRLLLLCEDYTYLDSVWLMVKRIHSEAYAKPAFDSVPWLHRELHVIYHFTVNCMSSTIGQGDREGAVGMQMQSCESVTWHKERAGLIGGRPVSYARETITG